jgi:isopentenyl diphosphate isomerase/L-lactate dehydrogenase-like FMN-dependent dehydrogenase
LTVFDFEAVFHAKLPRETYDYTSYGADSEFNLRRNRQAFDWVQIVPRTMADASTVKTATEVLGTKMAYPIMAAPSSGHGALHPLGETATHQGTTGASNTPMIVSNGPSFPLEKVAAAATGPLWYQLYPQAEIEANQEPLERAQAAGCRGIVVTVDQQASVFERPPHYRHLSDGTAGTGRGGGRGGAAAARRTASSNPYRVPDRRLWYEWKLFDGLRPFVKVPLLAKGIVTAEDARLCVEHGLDGVYVSNHGGRSMDYGPSTLEVLPEIVDAVQGRIPVLIDSGFRRGTDIYKALALGAKAVCLGRAVRWGLGAFGAAGVQRVLEILQAELVLAMANTGRPSLAALDRTAVRTDFP